MYFNRINAALYKHITNFYWPQTVAQAEKMVAKCPDLAEWDPFSLEILLFFPVWAKKAIEIWGLKEKMWL